MPLTDTALRCLDPEVGGRGPTERRRTYTDSGDCLGLGTTSPVCVTIWQPQYLAHPLLSGKKYITPCILQDLQGAPVSRCRSPAFIAMIHWTQWRNSCFFSLVTPIASRAQQETNGNAFLWQGWQQGVKASSQPRMAAGRVCVAVGWGLAQADIWFEERALRDLKDAPTSEPGSLHCCLCLPHLSPMGSKCLLAKKFLAILTEYGKQLFSIHRELCGRIVLQYVEVFLFVFF